MEHSRAVASRSAVPIARVPDLVTELHRVDLAFWQDWRTAAIVGCLAAANWRDGRPGKVSGIAATVQMSVSTVHSRLAELASQEPEPLVCRVPGGYRLTRTGDEKVHHWTMEIGRIAASLGEVWQSAKPESD